MLVKSLVTILVLGSSTSALAKKAKHIRKNVERELQEEVQKACGFGVRFDYAKAWPEDPENLNDGKEAIGKFVVRQVENGCAEDKSKVRGKLKTVSFITREGGSIAASVASGTLTLTIPDTDADGLIINWGWSDKEKFDPIIRDALRKGVGLKLLTEEDEKQAKKRSAEAKERAEEDRQKKVDEARDKKNQQDQAAREQKSAQIAKDFQADVARIQKEKANDPSGMAKALEAAQQKMQKRMQELETAK
jgi:hypothetical protein